MNSEKGFRISAELAWEEVGPGVRRQIMGHTPEMMAVRVNFEKGAVGTLHSHPHVQTCLVEDGMFEVTLGGETRTLQKGDAYIVESGVPHGATALTAGTLIDVFTPRRDDFLA